MTLLTVSALVSVMVVLNGAIALREESDGSAQLVKCQLIGNRGCAKGWNEIDNRCFQYFPTRLTWAQAQKSCESLGGNLASVHNIHQYHRLQSLAHNTDTWIGGSDAQEVSEWFWIDGTRFGYTNWCPGEPNNYSGRQHCIQMNWAGKKCWVDNECYWKRPYICVK